MLYFTKNIKNFIEDSDEEIMIYGAGNAGYWVGYYMNLCHIDFSCYLDKTVEIEGTLYNGKPIFSPTRKLSTLVQDGRLGAEKRKVRIFISIAQYQSAVYDLTELAQKYNLEILCLIPLSYKIVDKERKEQYAINVVLSYFRKKLFKGDIPTIISNDCMAGTIYQMLGLPMISPTINVGFLDEDYIKLCRNPKHYFDIEVSYFEMGRMTFFLNGVAQTIDMPCSKVDDITIYWGHTEPDGSFLKRWNIMRKRVNYNNLIFCMSNSRLEPSRSVWKSFSMLEQKHVAFRYCDKYITTMDENTVIVPPSMLLWNMEAPIENCFDILGWMNEGKE